MNSTTISRFKPRLVRAVAEDSLPYPEAPPNPTYEMERDRQYDYSLGSAWRDYEDASYDHAYISEEIDVARGQVEDKLTGHEAHPIKGFTRSNKGVQEELASSYRQKPRSKKAKAVVSSVINEWREETGVAFGRTSSAKVTGRETDDPEVLRLRIHGEEATIEAYVHGVPGKNGGLVMFDPGYGDEAYYDLPEPTRAYSDYMNFADRF